MSADLKERAWNYRDVFGQQPSAREVELMVAFAEQQLADPGQPNAELREKVRERDIEAICQKHFPQLKFYPELLPVIQESWNAGGAFASSIQEEGRRELEAISLLRSGILAMTGRTRIAWADTVREFLATHPCPADPEVLHTVMRELGLTDKMVGAEYVWRNTRAEAAEQQLAEARAQVEQAKKAILAAGHRASSQGGCEFKGCTCGAVETFKIESGEFWRQIQKQRASLSAETERKEKS